MTKNEEFEKLQNLNKVVKENNEKITSNYPDNVCVGFHFANEKNIFHQLASLEDEWLSEIGFKD